MQLEWKNIFRIHIIKLLLTKMNSLITVLKQTLLIAQKQTQEIGVISH